MSSRVAKLVPANMRLLCAAAAFAVCSSTPGSPSLISFSFLVADFASLHAARASAISGSTSGAGAFALLFLGFGGILLAVFVLLATEEFVAEEEVRPSEDTK